MEQEHVLQSDLSCSLFLMNMHSLLSMAPLYEFYRKKRKAVCDFYDLGSIANVSVYNRQYNMCAIEHESLNRYFEGWISIGVILAVMLRDPS